MNRSSMSPVLLGLVLAGGCTESGIRPITMSQVSATAGDFDRIDAPLDRMDVRHEVYEGIISAATWDRRFNPDNVALKVETLLGESSELGQYGALFVASGTRGLGRRVYNRLEPDDALVTDPTVLTNVRAFVQRGRALVVTDWAYDLVEAIWPDKIDFLNDDDALDDAQRGEIGEIRASVESDHLVRQLGYDTVSLRYDYSNWAVIEDVAKEVTVHLRGDVQYRLYDTAGDQTGTRSIEDVPLLVSFPDGSGGVVVVSTFHLDAQSAHFVDTMLTTLVGRFEPASSELVSIRE